MPLNKGRIWIGGLAGGVIWNVWSWVINTFAIQHVRYMAAQNAGMFLRTSRYHFFVGQWIVLLFILAIIVAHLYAFTRQTLGAGPGTALRIGFWVGFVAGVPENLAQINWSPGSRAFPVGWMLELWLGAILAAMVAGWFYKE
jgi:hypothetical protein